MRSLPTWNRSIVLSAVAGLLLLAGTLGAAAAGSVLGAASGPSPPVGELGSELGWSASTEAVAAAELSLEAGEGPAAGIPTHCVSLTSAVSQSCGVAPGVVPGNATRNPGAAIPDQPSARAWSSMTYDPRDGYVLLFGGGNATTTFGDTWTFVGGNWTKLNLTFHPSAREGASMAYDAANGYVVLFGGAHNGTFLGDTWKFAGGKWTRLVTVVHPSDRVSASMTYDPADGYVLLFGGFGDGLGTNETMLNDSWEFVDGLWAPLLPLTSPSAREGASMAYDRADGYVVLFGGAHAMGYLNDTWKFSTGNWKRIYPAAHPSAEIGACMTFDRKNGYVVLFGGYNATTVFGSTWTFVGGAWTKLSPGTHPPGRSGASMAYDAANGYVVLTGGAGSCGCSLHDTWKFVDGQWTRI